VTVSNVPIQTQVVVALKGYASGATAAVVARELDLSPEVVTAILDGMYASSRVECCLLGESIYLYRLAPPN
jgi:hypothetical protein